jgi:hypothetical protein
VLNRPSVPPLGTQLLFLQAAMEIKVVQSPALALHRSLILQLLLPRVDKEELTDLVRMGRRALYPRTKSECSIELWNKFGETRGLKGRPYTGRRQFVDTCMEQ